MRASVLNRVFLLGGPAVSQQPMEITNRIGLKLVLIPAGKFDMGSLEGKQKRFKDEQQHQMTNRCNMPTAPNRR